MAAIYHFSCKWCVNFKIIAERSCCMAGHKICVHMKGDELIGIHPLGPCDKTIMKRKISDDNSCR
jgi:hypothetical protein